MARKLDPPTAFVAWAETAPVEAVQMVLNIVKAIVAKRQPKASKPRVVKPATEREAVS
jgi:hypothetical protein